MRLVAAAAFHRAAELIALNNKRLDEQLSAAGIYL
jgi:hypothetical protein